MKAEFIDMEPGPNRPAKISIATIDEMKVLLQDYRVRPPFLFEVAGTNGHSLTVGLAQTSVPLSSVL